MNLPLLQQTAYMACLSSVLHTLRPSSPRDRTILTLNGPFYPAGVLPQSPCIAQTTPAWAGGLPGTDAHLAVPKPTSLVLISTSLQETTGFHLRLKSLQPIWQRMGQDAKYTDHKN